MTREEAIQRLKANRDAMYFPETIEALDMAIKALQDRPQGEWIDRTHCQVDEDAYEVATCSNCKTEITLEYPCDNFCPNCGARMYKGGDDE